MDDNLKNHLNKLFQLNCKDANTNIGAMAIQRWYAHNQSDPWPSIVAHLLSYNNEHDKEFEIDRISCKFLYMCDHCL